MNEIKPSKLTDAVKEALAKKHEASRPTAKTKKTRVKQITVHQWSKEHLLEKPAEEVADG